MMILSNEVLLLGLLWVVDPERLVVAHGAEAYAVRVEGNGPRLRGKRRWMSREYRRGHTVEGGNADVGLTREEASGEARIPEGTHRRGEQRRHWIRRGYRRGYTGEGANTIRLRERRRWMRQRYRREYTDVDCELYRYI